MRKSVMEALILFVISAIVSILVVLLVLPLEFELGGVPFPDPSLTRLNYTRWETIAMSIYGAIIMFSIQAIFALLLTYLTFKASKLYGGYRKLVLEYLAMLFLFYFLASSFVAIGHVIFAYYRVSVNPGEALSLLYPFGVSMGIMLSASFAYFLAKLSIIYGSEREPKTLELWPILLLYILLIISMMNPYNWFAAYPVEPKPNLRVITNGLLALLQVVASAMMLMAVKSKMAGELDPVKRHRLKLMFVSFALLPVFYIWYFLMELIQIHIAIVYPILFLLSWASILGAYLSLAAPPWYIKLISRTQG